MEENALTLEEILKALKEVEKMERKAHEEMWKETKYRNALDHLAREQAVGRIIADLERECFKEKEESK